MSIVEGWPSRTPRLFIREKGRGNVCQGVAVAVGGYSGEKRAEGWLANTYDAFRSVSEGKRGEV